MNEDLLFAQLERMVMAAEVSAWSEVDEIGCQLNDRFSGELSGIRQVPGEKRQQILGYYDRLIALVRHQRDEVSSKMGGMHRDKRRLDAYLST